MDLVRIGVPAMWLQSSDSISSGNSHLLMVFVGMVAVALTVQAIALIVMAVGAAKARKHGLEIAEDLKLKILPLIAEAHSMVRDTSPKLKVITENLVETSHVVRAKAAEFDVTMSDANDRARMQIARVDTMVGKTLTTTQELMTTLENAARIPVREIAGIVNGLKAGLDVLIGKAKYGFGTRQPPERDRDVY
jgi:hypothetical protein